MQEHHSFQDHVESALGMLLTSPDSVSRRDLPSSEFQLRRKVSDDHVRRLLTVSQACLLMRDDLVPDDLAGELIEVIGDSSRCVLIRHRAGEVLRCLITVRPYAGTLEAILNVFRKTGLDAVAREELIACLAHYVRWAPDQPQLSSAIESIPSDQSTDKRRQLLTTVIEPLLFTAPESFEVETFRQFVREFSEHFPAEFFAQIADHAAFSVDVRTVAREVATSTEAVAIADPEKFWRDSRVLVIQNIADNQGDEVVRVIPLLQSIMDVSDTLRATIITDRGYLYSHSRLTIVPIRDRARCDPVFDQRWDVVIEYHEPVQTRLNYSNAVHARVSEMIDRSSPRLVVRAGKHWDHFIFDEVRLDGSDIGVERGLNRRRFNSPYETSFRLAASLGLPVRLGRTQPRTGSVLACALRPGARERWTRLLWANHQNRPVALVGPFGGSEPLKGYVPQQSLELAELLRSLIQEGYFCVLLPNDREWGSSTVAMQALDHLEEGERGQVVIGPDPNDDHDDPLQDECSDTTTPPARSLWMQELLSFVHNANLVVTVDGWMMHAAYLVGKPLRILAAPRAHIEDWLPYGMSDEQRLRLSGAPRDVLLGSLNRALVVSKPWQSHLANMLVACASFQSNEVTGWKQRFLTSPDPVLRRAAVTSIGSVAEPRTIDQLVGLLSDPDERVRAEVSRTLLDRAAEFDPDQYGLNQTVLRAHCLIAEPLPDWRGVLDLGPDARAAFHWALGSSNAVIRREAAIIHRELIRLEERPDLDDVQEPVAERGSGSASSSWLIRLRDRTWRSSGLRNQGRELPRVLVLTPVKDAADLIEEHVARLLELGYPRRLISLGFLESDSEDGTWEILTGLLPWLKLRFRRARAWKHDFDYRLPEGIHRGAAAVQAERRQVLARSRIQLLFRALDDEDWVLWMDVDVVEYPRDLMQQLLATGKRVVQPHCVLDPGGPTFDTNGWRDHGRLHLDNLRAEGELVELDAVGGTVLLVDADLHRDGLIFPPVPYGRESRRARAGHDEVETEGLGLMARDMGITCWGLPHLEVIHRRE